MKEILEGIEEIVKEVEQEFPNDPALQQVHMARKILSREAASKGASFLEYVKLQAREIKSARAR